MKKTLLLCFTVILLTTMTSLISCKENAENTQNQSEPVEATIKVADVPE
ncbi:MAG TPA: RidA family protein, partial [Xanthomarina gelatinilytica]|nr:RidA family protein [Xanthomarina gelatinilytica]